MEFVALDVWQARRAGFAHGAFLGYFRPSFHPHDVKTIPGYYRWLASFERDRDPVVALNALFT